MLRKTMTPELKVLPDSDDQGKPGELPAYVWPGGYAMFYLTAENDMLCAKCATDALADGLDDPPVACGAFGATDDYPDDDECCANCNAVIAGPEGSE
jgi:hypothetical protein